MGPGCRPFARRASPRSRSRRRAIRCACDWRRTPLRFGLRAPRTAPARNSPESATTPLLLECGAVFRQRRLRGPARGGNVDADRGIGLGPDNLCEFAGFARALRRSRAGLDEEVLAIGRLRRRIFGARRRLGLATRCGATSGPKASTPGNAELTDGAGFAGSGWRPQLLVDVVGRKFALDARETRSQGLQNALQIRETRLRALVSARLFGSEFGQMRAKRRVDRGRTLCCERAACPVGLAQLFKQLCTTGPGSSGLAAFAASTSMRSWIVSICWATASRVDLAAAHILKSASDLVGDLFNDLPVDGRAALASNLASSERSSVSIGLRSTGDASIRTQLVENRLAARRPQGQRGGRACP